ncbi:MAG: efflux RND transporter permease subunit [Steroidobacteraceae bacterium]
MARFFIDRPIFAWVIALSIMLAGLLAIRSLPVAQYPTVAPPSVTISTSYPGASAKTVEDSVTQVIEQAMQGIDGMSYMTSSSNSQGGVSITLTFETGIDPDVAQMQVQNKLQKVISKLPSDVQAQGVTANKASNDILLVVGLFSDGTKTQVDLADYAVSNLQDTLARVDGVGEATIYGAPYAMRIWLDPAKLTNYKLTPADITAALAAQNTQVSAGQLGALPSVPGQQLNATINAQSRLRTVEQFQNILLRTETSGAVVKLNDVARIELGAESYDTVARYNGKPAVGIPIRLAIGANALATAERVKAKVAELEPFLPSGITIAIPYDTSPFVRTSIEEVVKTLAEAIVLVFLVMYLFLQSWRATLIPTIAVPVVLLGTFGVLSAFGYSINMLTMFATVLAIGLLVDDAIVVVENVERLMHEEHLSPLEATRKSMDQITGALIGIALVLSAVFVPMAFFGGSTGVIYKQFSVTIVSAMLLSVIVALILTPALCATLLKPITHDERAEHHGFFHWFNDKFTRGQNGYRRIVASWIARSRRILIVFAVLLVGLGVAFTRLPQSFLPDEDQGLMFTLVQLPVGATQERALKVVDQIQQHFMVNEKDAVLSAFTVTGFSFGGAGQNVAMVFVRLKDWSERPGANNHVTAIAQRANRAFSQLRDATVFAVVPQTLSGLGATSGFDLQLQDRGGLGHEQLIAARNMLLGMASKDPTMVAVRPNGQEDTPQLQLDIDTTKATAFGLSIADINSVLSTGWGGRYVNDFIDRGRVKKVFVQGEAASRMQPDDLAKWRVRNSAGDMVPLSTFVTARWVYGPAKLERYNGLGSVEIVGSNAPGKSTGDAMTAIEKMIEQLPEGIAYEWTGASAQERQAGSQAPALYALSILVVFLSLAALYESWSVPFAVMLVVPLGVLGAVLATMLRGLSNDVYFQVGLLTTIGLSAKNAILIVEFAKEAYANGQDLVEATLEGARLRLRPILMTSFAFALGVLPLALAGGAGSGAQNAIGTGVLGGMLFATALGIFFVPVFFVVVYRLFKPKVRVAA